MIIVLDMLVMEQYLIVDTENPFIFHLSFYRNRGGPYKTKPVTDLSRWRLSNEDGRQRWRYIEEGEEPEREQNFVEKFCLGLDIVSSPL